MGGFAVAGLSATAVAGYGVGVEPFSLVVRHYRPKPAAWPSDFPLTVAVIADLHASDPGMTANHIRRIVETTNTLQADLIVLLGDYVSGHRWRTRDVPLGEWSAVLKDLSAPLGVHAILGNHDWWSDPEAQARKHGPVRAGLALEEVGIACYHNRSIRLAKGDRPFWLAGLGDQVALRLSGGGYHGVDDLPGTLNQITDDAPAILLAHEPDIFPDVPARVALTLAGHTHGGQVRMFGYSPIVPSGYGNLYAYGHVIEEDRHLIVSGGLGCSNLPVRIGVPPEVLLVRLGAAA